MAPIVCGILANLVNSHVGCSSNLTADRFLKLLEMPTDFIGIKVPKSEGDTNYEAVRSMKKH